MRWSTAEHLARLLDALDVLDEMTVVPIELEGLVLRYIDREVQLTPQEAAFFRVLEQHSGSPVSHEAIREAGVNNPVKVKFNLTRKAAAAGIPLIITSPKDIYYLFEN